MNSIIYLVEKNIHGAWVVYGEMGVRQYYYYSKKECVRLYNEEYANTVLRCE